jgi:hypothetical protein
MVVAAAMDNRDNGSCGSATAEQGRRMQSNAEITMPAITRAAARDRQERDMCCTGAADVPIPLGRAAQRVRSARRPAHRARYQRISHNQPGPSLIRRGRLPDTRRRLLRWLVVAIARSMGGRCRNESS